MNPSPYAPPPRRASFPAPGLTPNRRPRRKKLKPRRLLRESIPHVPRSPRSRSRRRSGDPGFSSCRARDRRCRPSRLRHQRRRPRLHAPDCARCHPRPLLSRLEQRQLLTGGHGRLRPSDRPAPRPAAMARTGGFAWIRLATQPAPFNPDTPADGPPADQPRFCRVVQLVAHQILDLGVLGSSPSAAAFFVFVTCQD